MPKYGKIRSFGSGAALDAGPILILYQYPNKSSSQEPLLWITWCSTRTGFQPNPSLLRSID
jgi:hypothetical protein